MQNRSKIASYIAGLMVVSMATPSYAQETIVLDTIVLEEIVVTAQKREQNLQDVPISLTVLTGEQIIKTGAVDFETLSDSLPNVDIAAAPGINSVAIRGGRSGATNIGFEQSVGLFVDGVFASRIELFQEPFLDVDQIEVLKGPQGVLLGKNTTAGALVIHSKKPTDTFEGYVSGTYETEFDSFELSAALSGPLSENVNARLAIRDASKGAFIDNGGIGPDSGDDDSSTIRGQLSWDIGENTNVWVKAEASNYELTGFPFELEADFSPEALAAGSLAATFNVVPRGTISGPALEGVNAFRAITGIPSNLPITVPDLFANAPALTSVFGPDFVTPFFESSFGTAGTTFLESIFFDSQDGGEDFIRNGVTFQNETSFVDQESENFTIKLTHDFESGHEFTYVGSLAQFDRLSVLDGDFSATDILVTTNDRDFEQTSHEIRLASPVGGTIEYIVGAFYQDRELVVDVGLDGFGATANSPDFFQNIAASSGGVFFEDSETFSVFGSLSWNINPNLQATIGARYSDEEKVGGAQEERLVFGTNTLLEAGNPALAAFLDGFFGPISGFDFQDTIDETNTDPSFNLKWSYADDSLAYFSWTQATKAGGFDSAATSLGAFTFDSEEATSFEIGLKTQFLDGRARVNAAIFFSEFDDLQVSSFDPNTGATGAFVTTNAAQASSNGVELDTLFAINDVLTVGANVGYLIAEYDEFQASCPNNPAQAALLNCFTTPEGGDNLFQDLTGFTLENSPEWTASLFADYVIPLNAVDLGFRFDANFKGDTTLDFSQDQNLFEESYWKLNAAANVAAKDGSWSVGLGVFNLTDETPATFGFQAFGVDGIQAFNLTRGREIKATATYKF